MAHIVLYTRQRSPETRWHTLYRNEREQDVPTFVISQPAFIMRSYECWLIQGLPDAKPSEGRSAE
ncbi:hypothetical protein DCO57_04995 [Labrenzia sp. 011]|nr:hypothetical protein DCO57_04995 [Labrenzia sp. 011]